MDIVHRMVIDQAPGEKSLPIPVQAAEVLRQELGVLQGHLKGKDHVHDDGGGLGDANNGDVVDFPHLVLSGELEHLRILGLAAEKASHPESGTSEEQVLDVLSLQRFRSK